MPLDFLHNIKDRLNQNKLRLLKLISMIRLTPYDVSTQEGLANERYRRAALTTVTSVIAKVIGYLTAFITVPLTLHYLGTERYGLWMTISSVIVMLGFTDFGLGNGLVNAISQADGKNDRDAAQKAVSSVFFMLLGSAALLLFIFGIIYPFVPWQRFFNVKSAFAISESGPATAVFFICFALNIPLGIVQKVQLGYQEAFLNNYWQIIGNVIGFAAILIIIHLQAGLPWLVFAMSGVPMLVIAINYCYLFFYRHPFLLPRWKNFYFSTTKSLMGAGIIFMLLWLVNILGTSTDNIIIAQFLGPSQVATYAVVQRLFAFTFIVQLFTTPLWPAFSEALARSDFQWAKRTYHHINIIVICMTLSICLLLLLFGQFIIKLWAGPQVIPTLSLVLGYAMFRLVSGFTEAPMPVLMGKNYVNRLLIIATVSGVVAFILKIIFVPIWHSAGIAWASTISYGLFFVLPANILAYRAVNPGKEKQ
jgi:O-antigen/teichoic acid export membrane protein